MGFFSRDMRASKPRARGREAKNIVKYGRGDDTGGKFVKVRHVARQEKNTKGRLST